MGGSLRRAMIGVMLVLGLVLSACTGAGAQSPTPEATSAGSSIPASQVGGARGGPDPSNGPSVCDIGQQRDAKGACAPCPDLEGCYTSADQMQHFADTIIPMITEWADYEYEAMPRPTNWLYIPTGTTGQMACVDDADQPEVYNDMSYAYCPADKTVYLGEQALWQYYNEAGDAGAAVGIAHEFGHHIQRTVEVAQPANMSDQLFSITLENQADCVAGVWFQRQIGLGRVVRDDLEDIDKVIAMIASLEDDLTRDHGTVSERSDSFIKGMRGGLQACNAFFPDTPIIVA